MTGEATPAQPRGIAGRLRKRAEFLALRSGRRFSGKAFTLQFANMQNTGPARFGFTITRRIGNAVERNRIRRRLREAVRLVGVNHAQIGHDYVLIAKRNALHLPFFELTGELAKVLDRSKGEQPDTVGSRG